MQRSPPQHQQSILHKRRGDKEFIVIYLAAANLIFPHASASLQLHINIFENIKGVRHKMRHLTAANWEKKQSI